MSSSNSNELIYILPELVENILLRLSPYHLSRAKAVCKSWKCLIESPYFVNYYHNNANEQSNNHNNQLVSIVSDNGKIHTIEFEKLAARSLNFRVLQNMHPLINKGLLIGSCNGLICFSDEKNEFLLYNPSTQGHYTFEPSPCHHIELEALYGFGYDRTTYDYKIVSIIWKSDSLKLQIGIYSLKTKSWKSLYCPRNRPVVGNSHFRRSVFVNGSLYWSVATSCGLLGVPWMDRKILRFDVCSEEMALIPWPAEMKLHGVRAMRLGVLDGRLCAWFPGGNSKREIEAWVMTDKFESWTKLVSIQFDDGLCLMPLTRPIKPITLSKDVNKLFLAKTMNVSTGNIRFYCYDINTNKKIWEIELQNLKDETPRHYIEMEICFQSALTLPLDDLP